MPLDPPPAPGLAREKAADPSISPPAAALNPAGAASVSASSGASPAGSQPADDAFDETPYLRRGQLTRGPAPRDAVVLTYPMFEEDEQGRYTAVLALFIDETGRVQRIRVEPPGLPAPLEGAARRAFLAARFTPGEVDGRPVRSLIRIEVQFDRGDTTPE
ncbi:hypothetical protein [Rhizobacter sp. LjRoot28]|uniref:hypothetical protein n=1 Tax=Rhizobacter sp. LjRoot28 TaxID=3342309 RepID=UPI003ECEC48F